LDWKPLKGIYVLTIEINETIQPKIGALGKIAFPVGLYSYVGSAQNNLALRVARHKRKEKRLFWHIDYLLNSEAAKIIGVYSVARQKTEECRIASVIAANGGQPIAGFGCSDCHCNSHLFRAESFQFLEKVMQPMKRAN
jgi:Uri superfamily endonuclease